MTSGTTRAGGPSRQRIQALSEKLASLQVTPAARKSPVKAVMDEQLREYRQRAPSVAEAEETRMRRLREEMARVQGRLERERTTACSRPSSRQEGGSPVAHAVAEERRAREEQEARLLQLVDDRCFATRLELARAKKLREEAEERNAADVAAEVAALREAIAAERRDRGSAFEALRQRKDAALAALREELEGERRRRAHAETETLRTVEDFCGRVRAEIENERRDREATEEMILGLLEGLATGRGDGGGRATDDQRDDHGARWPA